MKPLIQLQAISDKPLRDMTEAIRVSVSRACGGIDDMHQLGDKALVVRAEIVPAKFPALISSLEDIGLHGFSDNLPADNLHDYEPDAEHPFTLQVLTTAGSGDGRVEIPKVPG